MLYLSAPNTRCYNFLVVNIATIFSPSEMTHAPNRVKDYKYESLSTAKVSGRSTTRTISLLALSVESEVVSRDVSLEEEPFLRNTCERHSAHLIKPFSKLLVARR